MQCICGTVQMCTPVTFIYCIKKLNPPSSVVAWGLQFSYTKDLHEIAVGSPSTLDTDALYMLVKRIQFFAYLSFLASIPEPQSFFILGFVREMLLSVGCPLSSSHCIYYANSNHNIMMPVCRMSVVMHYD